MEMLEIKNIQEILGKLAGFASLCWSSIPTGKFDLELCSEEVYNTATKINTILTNKNAEILELKEQLRKEVQYNEAWLYKNKKALSSVIKGLEQAAEGKLKEINMSAKSTDKIDTIYEAAKLVYKPETDKEEK